MLNSKLDNDFAMAYEVILEDLESGLKPDNRCLNSQIPCSAASSFDVGKQTHSFSEDDDVFMEINSIENNLETKDMWWCSSSTSSDQLRLVSKTCRETTQYRESSCISVLPATDRCKEESCDHEVLDITHQVGSVHLLDNTLSHPNDFHVDFLNLKSVYFTKDTKAYGSEDSLVYIFLKPAARIERVKVYLREWRNSTLSLGSLELQANFDKLRGLLTVDLNFQSPWMTDQKTKWKLSLLAQFEDGRTMSCCSTAFYVRAPSPKNRLVEIPLSHYQLHGRQPVIECSKTNCSSCTQHKRDISCDGGDVTIKLLPGSKLNYNHVSFEVRKDQDIVYIEEQSDLPGLLKQEKRRPSKDKKGLKKIDTARILPPETLSWVCGHCFFKRIKKSTVKSHVKQRVCLKRRRVSAESQIKQQRRRRGIARRSYTYPGIFF